MHPHAVAARIDEPGPSQIGEMTRHGRLRETEAVVDVADADFVAPNQREDAQARLVGQRAEHTLEAIDSAAVSGCCGSLHIFALTNISPPYIFAQAYIRRRTWTRSRTPFDRNMVRRRKWHEPAHRRIAAATAPAATRSPRTCTTPRRRLASLPRRSSHHSAAAIPRRLPIFIPARWFSIWDLEAESTCSSPRAASDRRARRTAWT